MLGGLAGEPTDPLSFVNLEESWCAMRNIIEQNRLRFLIGVTCACLAGSSLLAQGYLSPVESNKKVVFDFYRLVVEPQNPDLVPVYVADDFVDHDRPDDKGTQAVEKMLKAQAPAASSDIGATLQHPPKFVTAQGDLVVWIFDNGGKLTIEAYRIKDRKIIEHWKGAATNP